jgi:hypothetical protein
LLLLLLLQVFFSGRCPLLQRRLSLLHKILYTNGERAPGINVAAQINGGWRHYATAAHDSSV